MTFVQDKFTLGADYGDAFEGWHDPDMRWNGFANPVFNLAKVRRIKVLFDKWAAEMPDCDIETIDIDDDGRVFMINPFDGRIEENPIQRNDEGFPQDEPVFAIGSFGWTWLETNQQGGE